MQDARAGDVIAGRAVWSVERADCRAWLAGLPADRVDLVVTSPPYVDARTYGIGFALKGEDWVAWMRETVMACSRVCRGLIAVVCEGRTEGRRYDCTPFLLLADLHRHGLHCRKPAVYFRYGIPGSGGRDWWRNDWEPVLCFSRPGPLPWSDPTATGKPPKYGPGGAMSNRTRSGDRVNQWGGRDTSGSQRRADGTRQPPGRPSHRKPSTLRTGEVGERQGTIPAIANPGNVLRAVYDAEEVRQLLAELATRTIEPGDVVRCLAGGNHLGSPLAHENEAPYPESLVEPFVRCYCPPGGIVMDPFCGSGTTGAVAVRHGRRFVGCDLRECQVALARRRIGAETPDLFQGGS